MKSQIIYIMKFIKSIFQLSKKIYSQKVYIDTEKFEIEFIKLYDFFYCFFYHNNH